MLYCTAIQGTKYSKPKPGGMDRKGMDSFETPRFNGKAQHSVVKGKCYGIEFELDMAIST